MNCKNLKKRTKKGKRIFYCSLLKKEITFDCCRGCINKEFKEYKKLESKTEIKKRTYKLAKAERDRYSLFTDDLTHCIENKEHTGHIDKHEIFEGKNRQKSIKYNLVIPLCRNCHETPTIALKWQKIGRLEFIKRYSKDVFIKEFQTRKGE